jgi:hypothetical protein
MSEPFRCDDITPSVREAQRKEAVFHFRKAIAIASETASDDALVKAIELLIQEKDSQPKTEVSR